MADIKVRVGQQNAIKVVSSISGSSGGRAQIADNVIGGIASVTNLTVSGVSTFNGLSTFRYDTYAQNFYASNIFSSGNLLISGIASFVGGLYYNNYYANGVAYFNNSGLLTSTQSPQNGIDYTNSLFTINNSGIPSWSNTIDGGSY